MFAINGEIEVSKIPDPNCGMGEAIWKLPTGSVHHNLAFMKSCMETLTRNGINYQAQLVSRVERSSSHSTKNFTFDCSFHLCFHPSLSHSKNNFTCEKNGSQWVKNSSGV